MHLKNFHFLNQIHKEEIPLYKMPQFNLDSVLQHEYELDEKGVGRPYRFGYAFDIDYGMEHGKWIEFEDKNIWSIRFRSDMAYTLNFTLSELKLSNSAELYIYNSNGSFVYGPITSRGNATEEFRSMGSDIIAGEEVIIQIIEPREFGRNSSFEITQVIHGFRDYYSEILPSNDKKGDRFQVAKLTCHNDVMCYPDFENYSRGVAKLTMGGWLCSGALLNNTLGTNRPYLLTALHCADRNSNGASASHRTAAGCFSWQMLFAFALMSKKF